MATSNNERIIYADIQKKLFYMIPEKWEAIYLYASILEEPFKKPVGEMYFYYIPKGILKRRPVNVYEIPGLFNIDEESYNELVQKLFIDIRNLRKIHRETKADLWTHLTISIENFQFKIKYSYDDIGKNSEFTPYQRHIIWRYKYLHDDLELQTREEKDVISRYLNSDLYEFDKNNNDVYIEGIYTQPVHNIIDYERTLTVEAAIASQSSNQEQENEKSKQKKIKKEKDAKKKQPEIKNDTLKSDENQILFNRVDEMRNKSNKKQATHNIEEIDDDMILSSDFMTKK